MKNYLINLNGVTTSIFFNPKSPLSGVKQFFKSNHNELFKEYIEKNKNGKLFTEFLNEIGCKIDVVDFFDYSIKK
jgi:hypothetical protein